MVKHQLTFPVLIDPGNQIAACFRLTHALPEPLQSVYRQFDLDLERFNGDDSWTLPMPATYVIDTTGTIRAAAVNADYTHRPGPDGCLQILEEL